MEKAFARRRIAPKPPPMVPLPDTPSWREASTSGMPGPLSTHSSSTPGPRGSLETAHQQLALAGMQHDIGRGLGRHDADIAAGALSEPGFRGGAHGHPAGLADLASILDRDRHGFPVAHACSTSVDQRHRAT